MSGISDTSRRDTLELENYVKNFRIFIDTCSLLDDHANTFWERITPILQKERKSIIVTLRVYEEVCKFADNPALCMSKYPEDPTLNKNALLAKKRVVKMQKEGLVDVFSDENDPFADLLFQSVFMRFMQKYNLLLITQDKALASDIISIANRESVRITKKMMPLRIKTNGFLGRFKYLDANSNNTVGLPVPSTAIKKKHS